MPDITYPTANGDVPAYLAAPTGMGPWPGVVVVQDVLGMTSDLRRNTDRFAAAGYLALAPSLYGHGRKIKCVISTMRAAVAGRGSAHDNLVAARDYLIAHPQCTSKVGLAGFCMGADICLQLAPQGLFDAAAPNYGRLPKDIESLARSCPLVASYGAKDLMLPRGTATKLEAALAHGDVPHDVKEYPNVAHSFMNDWRLPGPARFAERVVRLSYSTPEAEDAWQRIIGFFKEHLT